MNQENNFEVAEKQRMTYKGEMIQVTADFSSESVEKEELCIQ